MGHNEEVKRICAEEYLNYIRSLVIRIKTTQEEIEHQKALLGPSGIQYRESVTQSVTGDALENGVIGLQQLIAEFCGDLAEYVEQQRIAHQVLSNLSRAEYGAALIGYYVHGKSWEQVCVDMSYSWQGMMKLRRKAIAEVYDQMPEEWRRYTIPNAI